MTDVNETVNTNGEEATTKAPKPLSAKAQAKVDAKTKADADFDKLSKQAAAFNAILEAGGVTRVRAKASKVLKCLVYRQDYGREGTVIGGNGKHDYCVSEELAAKAIHRGGLKFDDVLAKSKAAAEEPAAKVAAGKTAKAKGKAKSKAAPKKAASGPKREANGRFAKKA